MDNVRISKELKYYKFQLKKELNAKYQDLWNQKTLDKNFDIITFFSFVIIQQQDINFSLCLKYLIKQKVLDEYVNWITNKKLINEVDKNYQNLEFIKNKLPELIEKSSKNLIKSINACFNIKKSNIDIEKTTNLVNEVLSFFITQNQIDKFSHNIESNLQNYDNFSNQIDLFTQTLDIVNSIQKTLMTIGVNIFGHCSIALNILSKKVW